MKAPILTFTLIALLATLNQSTLARGIGGHVGGGGMGGGLGGGMGGFGGGGMGGFGGGGALAARAAGLGGGELGGLSGGDLAARAAALEGGQLGGLGGGDLAARAAELESGPSGYGGPGGGALRSEIASDLANQGPGGLRQQLAGLSGGAGGGDLASRLAAIQSGAAGGDPTKAQLQNFLNSGGTGNLSGETQSRLSQLYDQARSGGGTDGNLPGETQSKLSQLYDQIRAGDGPGKNFIPGETQSKLSQLYDQIKADKGSGSDILPGETQSKLSQLYDQIRAGDGPFHNYIPGETQKPLSRLYDAIRAGEHPLRPYGPWVVHRNAVVIRGNFNNYYIFTPGWYRRYPGAWYPAYWAYGGPWIYAPWPMLYPWLGFYSSTPIYYDYGSTVVYQNNGVYVQGQYAGTPAEYSQQAEQLASGGADQQVASDTKWMPLGVFAVSDGTQTTATDFFQLAVDKQGAIRGNYIDTSSQETKVVEGAVDKKTQRAAWIIDDDKDTVYETGIYNLTKDETPILVHLPGDKTEQLLLIRLEDKKAKSASDTQQDG